MIPGACCLGDFSTIGMEVSPCGATHFAHGGKVGKAPLGVDGGENIRLRLGVFSRLPPRPPFTGAHERESGSRIRRGWKFDLDLRRRPLPLRS